MTAPQHYQGEYRLESISDHVFYSGSGPTKRTDEFADWISSHLNAAGWNQAGRCLEIGAGDGSLLRAMKARFHDAQFEGVELNVAASERAWASGAPVRAVTPAMLPSASYDLIYAIAVIEHVPSPSTFLAEIRRLLRVGGRLILAQPTQDVWSYDLFFVDHMHHFGSGHIRQYAGRCGFRENVASIGSSMMPNFSLHLWRVSNDAAAVTEIASVQTLCVNSARTVLSDLARLDELIDHAAASGKRLAVFGLSEVYWLARAYSKLGDAPIVCGFDDRPHSVCENELGFPVVVPEECQRFGVTDVVLTMGPMYYDLAVPRIRQLGLVPHPLFQSQLS